MVVDFVYDLANKLDTVGCRLLKDNLHNYIMYGQPLLTYDDINTVIENALADWCKDVAVNTYIDSDIQGETLEEKAINVFKGFSSFVNVKMVVDNVYREYTELLIEKNIL